jgi:hypothetical protein
VSEIRIAGNVVATVDRDAQTITIAGVTGDLCFCKSGRTAILQLDGRDVVSAVRRDGVWTDDIIRSEDVYKVVAVAMAEILGEM